MLRFLKNIFLNAIFIIKRKKDLIFFPLLASVVAFLQHITDTQFNIKWIGDFNVWATSFIVSLFLFMLFDLVLDHVKVFKKYAKTKVIISFVVSTFIGETVSYTLHDDLKWWHYIVYAILAILFGLTIFICLGIGSS